MKLDVLDDGRSPYRAWLYAGFIYSFIQRLEGRRQSRLPLLTLKRTHIGVRASQTNGGVTFVVVVVVVVVGSGWLLVI